MEIEAQRETETEAEKETATATGTETENKGPEAIARGGRKWQNEMALHKTTSQEQLRALCRPIDVIIKNHMTFFVGIPYIRRQPKFLRQNGGGQHKGTGVAKSTAINVVYPPRQGADKCV
ncbi:uncharacterized protein LOC127011599 isoform X2 [Drosophila biarmipes]|uniref:uncharacterized protein LOC127011599 isoform X2 n=1 Tax=Drosophila biarmipes TaxID=125945 RepID=UPI0021CCC6D6|nr:uncharacterized protein LOC127011599 isoform X2 [Drosophila biarmipes]